jgi:hypothetical protein
MPYKLKDRNRPCPGGYGFFDSATNYRAGQLEDFYTQCRGVQMARMGNPGYTNRYNKSVDLSAIQEEVDEQWAQWCADHGYMDFVVRVNAPTGGAVAQAPPPHLTPKARNLNKAAGLAVVGIQTLAEMFGPDGPVDRETAEAQASVCAACPKNDKGDWTRLFTIPAAAAVRKLLEMVKGEQFTTTKDSELKVCTACGCPIRAKLWTRKEHVLKHMPKEDFDDLDPDCWIRK